jgi:hypothetical protein
MKRRTDAELGRIVRAALRGKRLKSRRLWDQTRPDGYLESDMDFFLNNEEAAVALLEALAPPCRRKTRS